MSKIIWSGEVDNWHEGDHLAEAVKRAGLDLDELDAEAAAFWPLEIQDEKAAQSTGQVFVNRSARDFDLQDSLKQNHQLLVPSIFNDDDSVFNRSPILRPF